MTIFFLIRSLPIPRYITVPSITTQAGITVLWTAFGIWKMAAWQSMRIIESFVVVAYMISTLSFGVYGTRLIMRELNEHSDSSKAHAETDRMITRAKRKLFIQLAVWVVIDLLVAYPMPNEIADEASWRVVTTNPALKYTHTFTWTGVIMIFLCLLLIVYHGNKPHTKTRRAIIKSTTYSKTSRAKSTTVVSIKTKTNEEDGE